MNIVARVPGWLRVAVFSAGAIGLAAVGTTAGGLTAQGLASEWLTPPGEIPAFAVAPPPPTVALSPRGSLLVLTTREALPDLAVLARPYLELAGRRVDGVTVGPQLGTKVTGIELRSVDGARTLRVDIPADHWHGPIWSADERAFALLRDAAGGAELWLADPWDAPPRQVAGVRLNRVLGDAVQWLPDQRRMLVKLVVGGEPPERPVVPAGPRVQEAVRGRKAPVRTYQDLLHDAHDGDLLEHYARCRLAIVRCAPAPGEKLVEPIGAVLMYERVDPSPDGTLLLCETIERPFSLQVPLERFPGATLLCDAQGRELRVLERHRLLDTVPIGGVPKGPRQVQWLATEPHALCWAEAQDGGDPETVVPHRDYVFVLREPEGTAGLWARTEQRAASVQAGGERLALLREFDRKTRRERLWQLDTGDPAVAPRILYERSTQDAYGDPGRPLGETLADGRRVLRCRDGALVLSGAGASAAGERPFLDRWQVATGEKARLFWSAEGAHETVLGFAGEGAIVVRSESPGAPTRLSMLSLAGGERRELLVLDDPASGWMERIERHLVRYQREDGVPMSGTLYLPPGHQPGRKWPCLLWAYPREFTSAADAGQVRQAPNRHVRPAGASHLFLLLHGYAVFDDASMPIVGPQRTANDSFVTQVQANGRAALAALAAEGCIDPQRVAVAGHSYGAFMTANLLAHTDLFACGIARSGAYNRTLTPFGFQNEERTFWQAPEVYQAMSPFAHADRIDEPLLLVHGDDDDNPGTFPLQSERLFAALQGHGGTARLCMLPHESHGYRSRQGVLHCLAEMCAWLDAHCVPRQR